MPNAGEANGVPENVSVPSHALDERRRLRVAVMGAGFSGVYMTILAGKVFQNIELVVYEKNPDLGGTWFENRYPGCACDIPAHNYTYSFEPYPEFIGYYAKSEEIWNYMKMVAEKYDSHKYIKFEHQIVGALWHADSAKWKLQIQKGENANDLIDDEVDVFINAGGILNKWQWPDIPGLNSFKGKLLHSARWDNTYDYEGKTIGVIGVGSSAIQIVPQMAKVASKLYSFIRSPTWIAPTPGLTAPSPEDPKLDLNLQYTQEERDRFASDTEYLLQHRRDIYNSGNKNFKAFFTESPQAKAALGVFTSTMQKRLNHDQRLIDTIIPDFPVGCRRLTPGPGFLEALVQDNVEVVTTGIEKITPEGVETTDGREIKVDVLVCATGFDTSYRPKFPLIGTEGRSLSQEWTANIPEAYFGVAIPGYPNYFTFMGPNTPVANGTLLGSIQAEGDYFAKILLKMQTENVRSLEVKPDVVKELNEHEQEYLKQLVFAAPCRSWYKGGKSIGKVIAVWCGSAHHYMRALQRVRWEDYTMTYTTKNRFSYLGNGFTLEEERGESNGWFLTNNYEEYLKLKI